MLLSAGDKPTLVARFHPKLWKKRGGGEGAEAMQTEEGEAGEASAGGGQRPMELPYRQIWAVASLDTVTVFDSERAAPLAIVHGLHLAPITDLAWDRSSQRSLLVSSSDGFCSSILFEKGELGELLPQEEYPAWMQTSSSGAEAAPTGLTPVQYEVQRRKELGLDAMPTTPAPSAAAAADKKSSPKKPAAAAAAAVAAAAGEAKAPAKASVAAGAGAGAAGKKRVAPVSVAADAGAGVAADAGAGGAAGGAVNVLPVKKRVALVPVTKAS